MYDRFLQSVYALWGALTPTSWPLEAFGGLSILQSIFGNAACTSTNFAACAYVLATGIGSIGLNPVVIQGLSTVSSPLQGLVVPIDVNICIAINNIVGINNPGGSPPTAIGPITSPSPPNWDQTNYPSTTTYSDAIFKDHKDICFQETNVSIGSVLHPYVYLHLFF